MVGKVKFEVRIRELVENLPDLAVLVEPMLIVRRTLREQIVILHRRLLAIVRNDEGVQAPTTTPWNCSLLAFTIAPPSTCPLAFEIEGSRSGRVWADVRQVSIGRGRSERQNITDAGHALRSSSEHAAVEEMVLAQSLGDADRQAPRDEEGDRGLARRLAVSCT